MDNINEEIAKLRGWKPPGHPDTLAYRKRNAWGPGTEWLTPDDKRCLPLPPFDTDWQATAELLEDIEDLFVTRAGGMVYATVRLPGGTACYQKHAITLKVAIAAAYLAAMETKDE